MIARTLGRYIAKRFVSATLAVFDAVRGGLAAT